MHVPGRGAFGAAACVQSAVKKTSIKEGTNRVLVSGSIIPAGPLGHCCQLFRQVGSGDDCGVALRTCTTPKGGWMSDAMRPPAR